MKYKVIETKEVKQWDWEVGGAWIPYIDEDGNTHHTQSFTKTFRKLFETKDEAYDFIRAQELRVCKPRKGGKSWECTYNIAEVEDERI
jgi:hypothetical protein